MKNNIIDEETEAIIRTVELIKPKKVVKIPILKCYDPYRGIKTGLEDY